MIRRPPRSTLFPLHDALPIWNGGIASLADFDSLRVEADVSESQVAKLAIGTPAEIVLDAFPDRRYRGKGAGVRPRGDRAEATVTVEGAFVGEHQDVVPHMGSEGAVLAPPPLGA